MGMFSWFLTWWHLQSLTLAHTSYQKLCLWSPTCEGEGETLSASKLQYWDAGGQNSEIHRDSRLLFRESRPTQFHIFSAAEMGMGKAREKQARYASALVRRKYPGSFHTAQEKVPRQLSHSSYSAQSMASGDAVQCCEGQHLRHKR